MKTYKVYDLNGKPLGNVQGQDYAKAEVKAVSKFSQKVLLVLRYIDAP